jgi:hypothetical protein
MRKLDAPHIKDNIVKKLAVGEPPTTSYLPDDLFGGPSISLCIMMFTLPEAR